MVSPEDVFPHPMLPRRRSRRSEGEDPLKPFLKYSLMPNVKDEGVVGQMSDVYLQFNDFLELTFTTKHFLLLEYFPQFVSSTANLKPKQLLFCVNFSL